MFVSIQLDDAILPLNRVSIDLTGSVIRFQNDSFVKSVSFDSVEIAKSAFKVITSEIQNLERFSASSAFKSLNFTKEALTAKLNTEAALGM